MERNSTAGSHNSSIKHPARFLAVLDSRKKKIRGLWRRGSKYYAQIRMSAGDGTTKPKRIPLDALTLDAAKSELEKKRTENRAGQLATPGDRPAFNNFADTYRKSAAHTQKKQSTQDGERVILEYWKSHLGGIRIDKISEIHAKAYREKRLGEGVTARTVNKEIVAFYSVLKLAQDRGLINSIPRVRQLKQKAPPKRGLLAPGDVSAIIDTCKPEITKNAPILKFYLRFLALTGAREKETLGIKWEHVDFEKRFVTIGADANSKNSKHRTINFSNELEALLAEMESGRPPDSSYLFPSPQRGSKDIPASSLRESFKLVRDPAGFPKIGFHDLRHFFASQCVMAGIDFMTIAAWLGHSDGGVLVGKVYGHLADDHKKRAAAGLSILGGAK